MKTKGTIIKVGYKYLISACLFFSQQCVSPLNLPLFMILDIHGKYSALYQFIVCGPFLTDLTPHFSTESLFLALVQYQKNMQIFVRDISVINDQIIRWNSQKLRLIYVKNCLISRYFHQKFYVFLVLQSLLKDLFHVGLIYRNKNLTV